MTRAILYFFLLTLIFMDHVYAESQVASMGESVIAAIARLPEGPSKAGLTRYLQIISPHSYADDYNVGTGNQGIQGFFEHHFATNDCFAETAFRFYSEVKKRNTSETRPTLKDISGEGAHVKNAKGWVMSLALRFTNGDKNKALALIGLCGHDDTNQGVYNNKRVEDKLRSEGWGDEDLFSYEEGLEDYKLCPVQASDFYLPQSLGASADVSVELKAQISRIQGEGKAEKLPAKYYHVMGASFLTCQMIEAGLRPQLAVGLQELAARAYRGIRLCMKTNYDYELFRQILKEPVITNRPAGVTLDQQVKNLLLRDYFNGSCVNVHKGLICTLLQSADSGIVRPPSDGAQQEYYISKINGLVDRIMAAGLYGSWYLAGHGLLKSLPCTDAQVLGPNPRLGEFVDKLKLNLNICGYGLSPEACRKSLQIIETWKVDFTWTVAQHRVGAKFAQKNCRKLEKQGDSLKNFCK